MAFWKIGGFQSLPAVERVLEKVGHNLKDVLEAEDVCQEVCASNSKLIEYLRQPNVLMELVEIVADEDEPVRAAEIHGISSVDSSLGVVAHKKTRTEDPRKRRDEDTVDATARGGDGNSHTSADSDDDDDDEDDEDDEDAGTSGAGGTRVAAGDVETFEAVADDDVDEKTSADGDSLKNAQDRKAENNSDSDSDSGNEDAGHNDHINTDYDSDDNTSLNSTPDLRKVATEILSANVWVLLDSLISHREAVERLWQILQCDEPSDSDSTAEIQRCKLRLTNFTKIAENLLEKRTDQMIDYARAIPNLTDLFMKHLDNPPLADLLLKIISTDHPDNPTDVLQIFYEQQLIPKMISRLAPEYSNSEQMAAGDFLKAFVTISGGSKAESCTIGPNELSRQLVSHDCIAQLLDITLKGGSGLCIAVGVIIEIIRKNNSDYDYVQVMYTTLESHPPSLRDSLYLGGMLNQFTKAIPQFQEILARPCTTTMEMPFCTIQPLGFERFRICELYAELLHCSNMALLNDPRGEEVIRKRDIERERVHYHLHQHNEEGESSTPLVSGPSSIANSRSSSDASAASTGSIKSGSSPEAVGAAAPMVSTTEDVDIDLEQKSPPLRAETASPNSLHSNDMQIDTPIKASTEGLTGEALAADLHEREAALRADPVVGDRLKIALADNECISTVFKMLFEFPWNNFLHNVVFDFVQQIFNGPIQEGYNRFLAIDLFAKDHITEQIVRGQDRNDIFEQERGTRLGYVGHLTLISEEVVKFAAVFPAETISPDVAKALSEPSWNQYVGQTLLKLRQQYNTILGGRRDDELENGDSSHDDGDIVIDDEEDDEEEVDVDVDDDEHTDLAHLGGHISQQQLRHQSDGNINDDDDQARADHDEDMSEPRDEESTRMSRLELGDRAGSAGTNAPDQFSRYMSDQLTNHRLNSSDDDDDDDDEYEAIAGDGSRARASNAAQLLSSAADDDSFEDPSSLELQRSHSYVH